ncbi:DUF2933 domain-containing protein [Nitrogeniibacter mangrovi]|uniref:DUF2933 domain-containing protein n=1 Tax=Nitrogeniibacter mangrovi TaxID=2016596 RepID=A0A6C1B569_9RHOO|nr:DUF2933 domain-containing protein [Nitrogeniibacter mangrovi]QID17918.1 DUF2933 domain-containing protein [Nitrogeniibacter mangrovi]
MDTQTASAQTGAPRIAWYRNKATLVGIGLGVAALLMVSVEFRAWFARAWPYLLFALCPLMHLFGHGHHGKHGHHGDDRPEG